MFLAVDVVIPRIRVFKLDFARLAIKDRLGLEITRIYTCYSHGLSHLLFRVKFTVHRL